MGRCVFLFPEKNADCPPYKKSYVCKKDVQIKRINHCFKQAQYTITQIFRDCILMFDVCLLLLFLYNVFLIYSFLHYLTCINIYFFSDCNPSFGYNNTISYILYNITCLLHVTTRVRNVIVRKNLHLFILLLNTGPYSLILIVEN